jgi:hypothetical protein
MVHLLPTVPYQEIGMTGDISGERLTSSSLVGVTSTVCVETSSANMLPLQGLSQHMSLSSKYFLDHPISHFRICKR